MQYVEPGSSTAADGRLSAMKIAIVGNRNAGKTTLAGQFGKTFFISTEGNALRSGYGGVFMEPPKNLAEMRRNIADAMKIAAQKESEFDTLVLDLIEDYDEQMQFILRDKLDNFKLKRQAWGDITAVYSDLAASLRRFSNKNIIYVSRSKELYNDNDDFIGYGSCLRQSLANRLLKDVDAEVTLILKDGVRNIYFDSVFFENQKKFIADKWNSIGKPINRGAAMLEKAKAVYHLPESLSDEWQHLTDAEIETNIKQFIKNQHKTEDN